MTHLVGSNDGILNTYKYDPFGRVLQQSEQKRNPYQYAGQHGVTKTYELDNMYVMPSGHYYAHHGRFINTDVEGQYKVDLVFTNNDGPFILQELTGAFKMPIHIL